MTALTKKFAATPLVSCVMPTCRRAHYLIQSIEYFNRQSYPNKELVIVYERAEDLPKLLPTQDNIKLVKVAVNASIGYKRSIGTKWSKGVYIAQWDDDDWYSSERLAVQLAPLLKDEADITGLKNHLFFDVWRGQFWAAEKALFDAMFRRGIAGGTLVFSRKYWSEGTLDYRDSSLREDADFMESMIAAGANLVAVDGQFHFVYLRHLNNTWSFVSGKLIQASAWQKVSTPNWFGHDLPFYLDLKETHFSHYDDAPSSHGVLQQLADISCVLHVTHRAQLKRAYELLEKQTVKPVEVIVSHPDELTLKYLNTDLEGVTFVAYEQGTQSTQWFEDKLAAQINCDYVMCWPNSQAWVSRSWLEIQYAYLRRHQLDATGLSQPFFFFPSQQEFWQYIASDNQITAWLHAESLCCTKEFYLQKHRGFNRALGFNIQPHQHLEHFLAFADAQEPVPNTEKDPKWFPYQSKAIRELYSELDIGELIKNVSMAMVFFVTTCLLLIPSWQTEASQVVEGAEQQAFPADFFSQYNPQNALDMIYRLPGFSFENTDSARGFGSNVGNVLINGARPAVKSESLAKVLSRIGASQVHKVNVYRGSKIPLVTSGKVMVADVILIESKTTGVLEGQLTQFDDGSVLPKLALQLSTHWQGWATSVGLEANGTPGYRTAKIRQLNNDEVVTSQEFEALDEKTDNLKLTGQLKQIKGQNEIVLTGKLSSENYLGDTTRYNVPESDMQLGALTRELKVDNDTKNAELGVDWTRNLDDYRWQNMGIFVVEDKQYANDDMTFNTVDKTANVALWRQQELKTELILRSTIEMMQEGDITPRFGIEMTENRMQSSVSIPSSVNKEVTDVNELRAEVFADINYTHTQNLSSEFGLTYEASQIDVEGLNRASQSLSFWKPRWQTSWSSSKSTNLNWLAEHRISQLNFSDFARSVDAGDGRNQSGNTELKPEQTTELSTQYQWYFSKRGNFKAKLYYQWRKDVLEHIAFSDSAGGLANVGDAKFWGSHVEVAFELEPILENALFEVSYEHKNSDFTNPNGRTERLSNYIPDWIWMNFRHDIPKYKSSWGVEYWGDYTEPFYFAHETLLVQGNKRVKGFIESSLINNIKMRFEVTHMNTGRFIRTRTFYQDGLQSGHEIADRTHKAEYRLSVWYRF
ncbi:glycosyltransferase [Pseudoalteromonas luteoviolacea]|uniref:glycosyltransferase n=1 Tax=Pseudoalteromonas luteoviolacea TaxID=43657 RepID=UPI00115431A2|nr:glycosyltransferase [Pseudoalteromonas luteoviolacea]TQF72765.1 glycosyltransferase [Pseudoalteromonas luteoviolacea]